MITMCVSVKNVNASKYSPQDEFSDNVRDFADLDDTCPLLVILDSPEQNVYVCTETKITPNVVVDFVNKFLQGELIATPIPPLCGDINEKQKDPLL